MHCEIYPVAHEKSFRWKWRQVDEDGRVEESQETYFLYYDCVTAARSSGYQPRVRTA
jgi:hypothetical protein